MRSGRAQGVVKRLFMDTKHFRSYKAKPNIAIYLLFGQMLELGVTNQL